MTAPAVKRCGDCRWSVKNASPSGLLSMHCANVAVNSENEHYLAGESVLRFCAYERARGSGWLSVPRGKCGRRGLLWEPKT